MAGAIPRMVSLEENLKRCDENLSYLYSLWKGKEASLYNPFEVGWGLEKFFIQAEMYRLWEQIVVWRQYEFGLKEQLQVEKHILAEQLAKKRAVETELRGRIEALQDMFIARRLCERLLAERQAWAHQQEAIDGYIEKQLATIEGLDMKQMRLDDQNQKRKGGLCIFSGAHKMLDEMPKSFCVSNIKVLPFLMDSYFYPMVQHVCRREKWPTGIGTKPLIYALGIMMGFIDGAIMNYGVEVKLVYEFLNKLRITNCGAGSTKLFGIVLAANELNGRRQNKGLSISPIDDAEHCYVVEEALSIINVSTENQEGVIVMSTGLCLENNFFYMADQEEHVEATAHGYIKISSGVELGLIVICNALMVMKIGEVQVVQNLRKIAVENYIHTCMAVGAISKSCSASASCFYEPKLPVSNVKRRRVHKALKLQMAKEVIFELTSHCILHWNQTNRMIVLARCKEGIGLEFINYRLCVDVWTVRVKWEDLSLDLREGKRKRFSPVSGVQIIVKLIVTGITQDWIKVSGSWKCGGTWPFLEVLEMAVGKTEPPKIKEGIRTLHFINLWGSLIYNTIDMEVDCYGVISSLIGSLYGWVEGVIMKRVFTVKGRKEQWDLIEYVLKGWGAAFFLDPFLILQMVGIGVMTCFLSTGYGNCKMIKLPCSWKGVISGVGYKEIGRLLGPQVYAHELLRDKEPLYFLITEWPDGNWKARVVNVYSLVATLDKMQPYFYIHRSLRNTSRIIFHRARYYLKRFVALVNFKKPFEIRGGTLDKGSWEIGAGGRNLSLCLKSLWINRNHGNLIVYALRELGSIVHVPLVTLRMVKKGVLACWREHESINGVNKDFIYDGLSIAQTDIGKTVGWLCVLVILLITKQPTCRVVVISETSSCHEIISWFLSMKSLLASNEGFKQASRKNKNRAYNELLSRRGELRNLDSMVSFWDPGLMHLQGHYCFVDFQKVLIIQVFMEDTGKVAEFIVEILINMFSYGLNSMKGLQIDSDSEMILTKTYLQQLGDMLGESLKYEARRCVEGFLCELLPMILSTLFPLHSTRLVAIVYLSTLPWYMKLVLRLLLKLYSAEASCRDIATKQNSLVLLSNLLCELKHPPITNLAGKDLKRREKVEDIMVGVAVNSLNQAGYVSYGLECDDSTDGVRMVIEEPGGNENGRVCAQVCKIKNLDTEKECVVHSTQVKMSKAFNVCQAFFMAGIADVNPYDHFLEFQVLEMEEHQLALNLGGFVNADGASYGDRTHKPSLRTSFFKEGCIVMMGLIPIKPKERRCYDWAYSKQAQFGLVRLADEWMGETTPSCVLLSKTYRMRRNQIETTS